MILPPFGKEYMCFLKDGKTDQATRCIKSRIMTKVIDYVLSIDTFEQLCVVLKGILQSPQLKDHTQTIGIDQSLSNNAIYENKCIEDINKLYKRSGKCDGKQQLKDTLEYVMVYYTEVLTDNSPISTMTSTPAKTIRARKSLCLFTNLLDAEKKTATR